MQEDKPNWAFSAQPLSNHLKYHFYISDMAILIMRGRFQKQQRFQQKS